MPTAKHTETSTQEQEKKNAASFAVPLPSCGQTPLPCNLSNDFLEDHLIGIPELDTAEDNLLTTAANLDVTAVNSLEIYQLLIWLWILSRKHSFNTLTAAWTAEYWEVFKRTRGSLARRRTQPICHASFAVSALHTSSVDAVQRLYESCHEVFRAQVQEVVSSRLLW